MAWAMLSVVSSGYVESGEMVPCVDNQNREFEDEMCREKIGCAGMKWDILFVFGLVDHCDAFVSEEEQ